MVTNVKYRSVYTGAEIDQAIASMRASGGFDPALIVNDFNGGTAKIASAEIVKTLKDIVDGNNAGSNIKAQLLSVPDTKVLTDAEYSRVTYLAATTSFRGTYANAAARDASLATEYAGYTGKEFALILDDGSGDSLQEFSRWDTTSNTWKKINLVNNGGSTPQLVAAAGPVTLFNYRTNRYSAMKCLVVATNAAQTQRQVQEVLITHVGSDTYISVYNEVGNVETLFDLSSTIVGGLVNLVVTTKSANITITGKKIAEI